MDKKHKKPRPDFVITRAAEYRATFFPGERFRYRGPDCAPGRGYRDEEAAWNRCRDLNQATQALCGRQVFTVIERS